MLSVWLRQELEKNVISRIPSDRKYLCDIYTDHYFNDTSFVMTVILMINYK